MNGIKMRDKWYASRWASLDLIKLHTADTLERQDVSQCALKSKGKRNFALIKRNYAC